MLIPVRCVTCGKVISDKWNAYLSALAELEASAPSDTSGDARDAADERSAGRTAPSRLLCAREVPKVSPAGRVLNQLGITKICCRRHFLTNVDMLDSM